ncbi:DUF323 domain-containing protein [Xylaria bambusicola]|uniref:DUF323 domain-containing protein n=1 Tax=Xylaria bambusicola TaxID=326684 RepID=UPI002007DFB1|nr:DUF323 domain-containing protein [Xylaria bambusicola]KAI0523915.1 DUF323 domain-containing protein [Xylaria bambusicola]
MADSITHSESVIDIGGSKTKRRLQRSIAAKIIGFDSEGRHFLPDIFFSDDDGLQIWRDINRLPDYYQTRDEIETLEKYGAELESFIPNKCTILDLGCGDVRKTKPLLDRLETSGKDIFYFGLDLSLKAVQGNIDGLRATHKNIQCTGLWGTFEDGLEWAKGIEGPMLYLSLGSIFANDRLPRAIRYLQPWHDALRPDDLMLIGVDCLQDPELVWKSYHDTAGVFERFIRNAFAYSNRVVGVEWFRDEDWDIRGELELNPVAHHFVLRAVRDVDGGESGISFKKDDEITCYGGYKQTPSLVRQQFQAVSLTEIACWPSPSGKICECSRPLTRLWYLLSFSNGRN